MLSFIKCSYKANDGVLYFLEKNILFAHKPVLDIILDSIKEIEFLKKVIFIDQFQNLKNIFVINVLTQYINYLF